MCFEPFGLWASGILEPSWEEVAIESCLVDYITDSARQPARDAVYGSCSSIMHVAQELPPNVLQHRTRTQEQDTAPAYVDANIHSGQEALMQNPSDQPSRLMRIRLLCKSRDMKFRCADDCAAMMTVPEDTRPLGWRTPTPLCIW